MSEPGYYKTNARALSLRGVARKWGLLRLPLTYLVTRFQRSSPGGWMPSLWKDLECAQTDLSERFWRATVRQREDFTALGFVEVGFKRVKEFLNPLIRDHGGINYLDADRRHFGQLLYNRAYAPAPISAERENVNIAFTTSFGPQSFSCTNNKTPFDAVPRNEVVRVQSNDVQTIYLAFTQHLARRSETPQQFADNATLRAWFDENQIEVFEYRVRTGLFVKMTDAEVAAARRKLPPPLPNA
jgi:hypothetical protein